MDFFAFFNCSLTLCLWCMPCYVYSWMLIERDWILGFLDIFFKTLPSQSSHLQPVLKNCQSLFYMIVKMMSYLMMSCILRFFFFFFSINRVLAQCYSKSKWMYTCCMWFSKLMDIYSFVWSSPRTRVTSDNFKLSISETIDTGGLKCYCDLWSVPVCDSHKNQSLEIPHLVAMPTLH